MSNILLNTIKSLGSQLQILEPITAPSLTVSITDNALNLTSGAIQVAGGIAVTKDIFTTGHVVSDILRTSSGAGSDTKSLNITSFGSSDITSGRGAGIRLDGVDSVSGGALTLVGISKISLQTGTTERMVMNADGSVVFNHAVSLGTTLSVTGNSTMSGTLVVTGALGVTAPVFSVSGAGTSVFDKMEVQSTIESTAVGTGSLVVSGGVGVAKSLVVGGSLTGLSGGITVNSTTESTILGSGSIVTLGGVSVAKSMNVGGTIRVASTMDSSTPLTGAVTILGGLGVVKGLSTGGPVRTLTGEATHWELALTDGSPKWAVGVTSVVHDLTLYGSTSGLGIRIDSVSGNVSVNSTHASMSINTLGGISVAKGATIGGTVNITSAVDSSGLSSGSLQVTGGTAVGKNLFVGQSLDVAGMSSILGDIHVQTSVDVSASPLYGSNRISFIKTGYQRVADSFTPLVITKWDSSVPLVGITEASIHVHANTNSTSTTTGALIVTGGIATGGSSVLSGVSVGTLSVRGDSISISATKNVVSDVSGSLNINPFGHFTQVSLGQQNVTVDGTANLTLVGGGLLFDSVHRFTPNGQWLYNTNGSSVLNSAEGTSRIVMQSSGMEIYTGATNNMPSMRQFGVSHSGGVTCYTPLESQASLFVSVTTESSSLTTGAVRISGGAAVAKNLYVGGVINCASQVDINGTATMYGQLFVTNATDSTSTNTGAIVTTGGIGVKLNASIGGDLLVSGTQTFTGDTTFGGQLVFLDTTDTTILGEGSLILSGGVSVEKGLVVGGAVQMGSSLAVTGQVTISNASTSGSSSSGAFVVTGGVGIGEKLFVQNNVTTAGNLSVAGNSTLTGTITLGSGTLALSNVLDIFTVRSATAGMSITATGATANSQYSNLFTMFSLGTTLLDVNYEALQLSTLGTTGYTLMTRNAGTGVVRELVLQTGTNTSQVALRTSGAVELPLLVSIANNTNPSKTNANSSALSVTNGSVLLGGEMLFATDAPSGSVPSTSVRASGTRIVLYPNVSGSTYDTSIGIDSSNNAWILSQTALRVFSNGGVETLRVTRNETMVATSVTIGSLPVGSASGSTMLKIQNATEGSIQLSPTGGAGGAVSIRFASDDTMTQTGTTGSVWNFGRNINSSGLTTMALSMSGPSGDTTVQYWDNNGNSYITSTTQTTVGGTGALVVSGGASVEKNLLVGGNLTVTGTINGAFTGTSLTLSDTTQSTSIGTGTLIVSGGTGIAKNLYVGGNIVVPAGNVSISSGTLSVTGDTTLGGKVLIQNTEDSTSPITGSLVTLGGIAVTKTLYANGAIVAAGQIIQLGDAFITNDVVSGLYLIPPNASAGLKIRNSGNTSTLVSITDAGPMTVSTSAAISATGNSTSSLTGALTVAGGVGIIKDVNVGGTISSAAGAIFTGNSLLDKVVQISSAVDIPISRALEVTYPNLTAGNMTTIGIGKNASVKNMGTVGFRYSDDQNNNNVLTLGVSGSEGILGVWGNSCVSIGGASGSAPTRTLAVTGTMGVSGIAYITDTSQSTSIGTGCLLLSGGAGIAKNVYVGGSIDVSSASLFRSSVQFNSTLAITDTTETNALGQGSVILSGGLSVAKTVYIGTELHVIGGLYGADAYLTGNITTTSTTQSSSTTTGSLVLAGGAAIGKNLYVGGNLNMVSSSGTLTVPYLTITDNTLATTPTTGAVKISGGIGLQGNLFTSGAIRVQNNTASTEYTSGALVVDGGVGIAGDVYTNGTIVATGSVTSTSDARLKTNVTDLPTGALDAVKRIRAIVYEFKGLPSCEKQSHHQSGDNVYGPRLENQYMGVLAQELEDVLPSVVYTSKDKNATRSVDYARLSIVLIKAVQELSEKLDTLLRGSK